MSHLLDSVILIDHFNDVAAATRFIEKHAAVLAGFTERDVALGAALLDSFQFLPMYADIADEAARIRRQSRLKLPDAIQAAFATRHGLKLVTRNTRTFHQENSPSSPFLTACVKGWDNNPGTTAL